VPSAFSSDIGLPEHERIRISKKEIWKRGIARGGIMTEMKV
jgi:hypothetical protein